MEKQDIYKKLQFRSSKNNSRLLVSEDYAPTDDELIELEEKLTMLLKEVSDWDRKNIEILRTFIEEEADWFAKISVVSIMPCARHKQATLLKEFNQAL